MLKDFPKTYRKSLRPMRRSGYARVPSMPGSRLDLNFKNFEDYLQTRLSHKTRKNLRSKYRKAAAGIPIKMEMVSVTTAAKFVTCCVNVAPAVAAATFVVLLAPAGLLVTVVVVGLVLTPVLWDCPAALAVLAAVLVLLAAVLAGVLVALDMVSWIEFDKTDTTRAGLVR